MGSLTGRLAVPDSVVDLAPVVPVVVLHEVEAAVPLARALVAGGSWMTPPDVDAARDGRHVQALAREAATLAVAA